MALLRLRQAKWNPGLKMKLTITGRNIEMKVQNLPRSSVRAFLTACFSVSSRSRYLSFTSCKALSSWGWMSPLPVDKDDSKRRGLGPSHSQSLESPPSFAMRFPHTQSQVWPSLNVGANLFMSSYYIYSCKIVIPSSSIQWDPLDSYWVQPRLTSPTPKKANAKFT